MTNISLSNVLETENLIFQYWRFGLSNLFLRQVSNVGRVAQSVYRLSYGLDGPESNPCGDEIFRPSRPALGPTQPPVKWVPGLSRG